MHLVIVESPAKCGKIQGFLGEGYRVIATMGHIRALEENLDAIGLSRDFDLRYKWLEEKSRAIQGLRAAAKEAATVILAADDDREGEAIAYSVCVLLGLNATTVQRAVFHEITKKAVTAAVGNPRKLDMNRVNAQAARAALDMMIGFTISPLLWKHVARGLSAGRCQTPALRLVADREEAIEKHVAGSSWKLSGGWTAHGGLVPYKFDAAMVDELEDEESARNYLEMMRDEAGGNIRSAAITTWKSTPPVPFITSTLQQAASTVMRSGPKKTMAAAQKLYEAGHITYMRTDSAVLSEEAKAAAREWVKERFGEEFCGGAAGEPTVEPTARRKKTAAAAAGGPQEAHEAIRPTHFELEALPQDGNWTSTESRLYKMIWTRAVQSTMAAAHGEQKTLTWTLDGADDFAWRASWRRTLFLGWRKLGEAASEGGESGDSEGESGGGGDSSVWDKVVRIGQGDRITWNTVAAVPHEAAAAKRYTEATLIKELEKSGIGRPSTFASLVETIKDKAYVVAKDIPGREVEVKSLELVGGAGVWPPVEKIQKKVAGGEKDKLVPTELGRQVVAFSTKHFADLFDYRFTAAMEARLDRVAKGEEAWKAVLRDTWETYKERYESLGAGGGGGGGAATGSAKKKIFNGGVVAVIKKTGEPLLLKEAPTPKGKATFYGWPAGVTFEEMTEEKAAEFIRGGGASAAAAASSQQQGDVLGHWNGVAVIRRAGKFGTYVVCGDKTVSCGATATLEEAIAKLEEKAAMKTRVIGGYELRQTEKGAYMFKKALATKKFVTVPAGLDIMALTAKEVEAIYKTGTGGGGSGGGSSKAAPRKKFEK